MRAELASDAQAIARAFVTARRSRRALPAYPGVRPRRLADAYRVQDAAIAFAGRQVGGWKVGRINPPIGGVNRFAGPILADGIVVGSDRLPSMPVFRDGFAAAEAEFMLRIGAAPDPARRSYTMADARAMIDAVHVGIEIASSPFAGINADGPAVAISDFGNNNGLLIGTELPGWRDRDLNAVPVESMINGERIGAATAATMLDGPWGAVRFLLEHMATRGIALPAGSWISTGAVTGVHRVAIGDAIEARFDGQHSVCCTISP